MTTDALKLWAAFLFGLTLSVDGGESAPTRLTIWAPGMEEPRQFAADDDELSIDLGGSHWAYLIKGMSGGIALGNENEEGNFWKVNGKDPNGWGGKKSWASVGLEVNGCPLLETGVFFSVSGDHPGVLSDETTTFLPTPMLVEAQSDGTLVLSVAALVNSSLLDRGEGVCNENPVINLTLLADLYRKPPETSGEISTRSPVSARTRRVTLHWQFSQGERATSQVDSPLVAL